MTDDLISRADAIDAMTSILWHYPNECYRKLNEYEFAKRLAELGLKSVPSAQRTGKWIDMDEQSYTWKVRCSCCDHERSMLSTQGEYPNYCENCGCRMVEDER